MKNKIIEKMKTTLFIVGVITTVVTALTGCAKKEDSSKKYGKENEVAIQNTTNENVQKTNENNVQNALLKDTTKPVIYSYIDIDNAKSFDTPNGGSYSVAYKYKIPQININSEYANIINNKISSEYEKIYNDYKTDGDSGCCRVEYNSYINNDILSVEIAAFWDGGSVQRSAYNINVRTGNEVSHQDLLKERNITEEEFTNKLSNLLKELFKTMYTPSEEMTSPDTVEFFSIQYKKTTDTKNCSVDNDMFLNDNNELCVVVKRYNLAGADSTKIIINFDKKIIQNDEE